MSLALPLVVRRFISGIYRVACRNKNELQSNKQTMPQGLADSPLVELVGQAVEQGPDELYPTHILASLDNGNTGKSMAFLFVTSYAIPTTTVQLLPNHDDCSLLVLDYSRHQSPWYAQGVPRNMSSKYGLIMQISPATPQCTNGVKRPKEL